MKGIINMEEFEKNFLESPFFGAKICLCGSTKFKAEFEKIAKLLTLRGAIITMPCVFHHAGDEITEEEKITLDLVHRLKIRDADLIFVIDCEHYIGKSTKREIEYAQTLNKNIIYWSDFKV